jgi:hypothetical protein
MRNNALPAKRSCAFIQGIVIAATLPINQIAFSVIDLRRTGGHLKKGSFLAR